MFQMHTGHYEFRVMAFGLSGAPAMIELAPLLHQCVLVFFDDILIYSMSYEERLHHVRAVLQLLAQDHWQVKH